jgi:hypothetical protein
MKTYIFFYVCLVTGDAFSGLFYDTEHRTVEQIVYLLLTDKNHIPSKLVLWDYESTPPTATWFHDGVEVEAKKQPEIRIEEITRFMKLMETDSAEEDNNPE